MSEIDIENNDELYGPPKYKLNQQVFWIGDGTPCSGFVSNTSIDIRHHDGLPSERFVAYEFKASSIARSEDKLYPTIEALIEAFSAQALAKHES